MDMRDGKNYQPVMIRYLNQNRGKVTKKQIQEALHNANPTKPVKDFSGSPVFDVLTDSRNVARRNAEKTEYELLDYDTFSPAQKAHITMYCDQKIKDSSNPVNPRIVLFSAAGKKSFEHFNETITKDVVSKTLPGNTILKDFDATRVWGSIYNSQNHNKWKELKKGDILLFYHNKKYLASGILEGTEHNQELADYLWGVKDEDTRKTFELIVFMQPTSVFTDDVDFQKLNKLLGYNEDFMPTRIMDFTTVNKDKTDDLIEQHGSLENALKTVGFSFSSTENTADSFEQMIQKFDNNRKLFNPERISEEERELILLEFTKKFPQNQTLDMMIEDYVFGTERHDTFCHYIGSKIPDYGNIGRFNAKYCVYWKSSENRYEYLKKYSDYQTAFDATKTTINNLLLHAHQFENDLDWNAMDDFFVRSQKNIRTDVKSKILAVYFPQTFLDIHSLKHMVIILKYFGISTNKIKDNHILLQEKILEIKDKHPVMRNWSIQDYSHFVWQMIIENESEITQTNYLLFYHSPSHKKSHADRNVWDDVIGKEYPYGNKSGATSKVTPGSKTVWYFTQDDEMYFWGHGEIESKKETSKNKSLATMAEFERLTVNNEPKKATVSLQKNIQSHKGWNISNAVIEIDKEIYDMIVNDEEYMEDKNLELPKNKLESGIKKIQEELLMDPEVIKEIVIHLASKRHVLLAGPVGTGKTRLAQLIPQVFWSENGGYYPEIHTATADWSTQDVIGGIMPQIDPDNSSMPTYAIENGCVTSTILDNFNEKNAKTDQFDRQPRTHSVENEEKTFHGTWLVIDEFNRADIDKAFGQLFTALEYGKLKVPNNTNKKAFREIPIPKDYRIIGTMNTADKHYLFNLSDALKRRFAYVEVPIPKHTAENKKKEIFLAFKNALKELDNDFSDIVKIGKTQLSFNKPTDKVDQKLEHSFAVMEIVRIFKPLGTAILKSIFQTLMVSEKMNEKNSLDRAINANIIPQLETLQKSSLEMISELLFGNPTKFIKDMEQPERYSAPMESLLNYLDYTEVEIKSILIKFNENDFQKHMSDLEKRLDTKIKYLQLKKIIERDDKKPDLPIFSESIKEMIKQSEFI